MNKSNFFVLQRGAKFWLKKNVDFFQNKSLEDPGTSEPEEHRDEPNTFQESYDDINVDHLLSNFQLVGFGVFFYILNS